MGIKTGVARTCEVEPMAGPLHFSGGMLSKVTFWFKISRGESYHW